MGAFCICKKKIGCYEKYKQFVADGKGQPSPWEFLQKQIYLGTEQFVVNMQAMVDGEKELSEIPSSQRRPTPKSMAEYESLSNDRNMAITRAYKSGGYTLKEIGDYFGLHYSSVSGIIKNQKSKT